MKSYLPVTISIGFVNSPAVDFATLTPDLTAAHTFLLALTPPSITSTF